MIFDSVFIPPFLIEVDRERKPCFFCLFYEIDLTRVLGQLCDIELSVFIFLLLFAFIGSFELGLRFLDISGGLLLVQFFEFEVGRRGILLVPEKADHGGGRGVFFLETIRADILADGIHPFGDDSSGPYINKVILLREFWTALFCFRMVVSCLSLLEGSCL